MTEKFTRTLKTFIVTIKDGQTGEILKTEILSKKPDTSKVAVKFIKETGKTNFLVDVKENEETREISLEDFMKYSKVVEPKQTENQNNTNEESEGK